MRNYGDMHELVLLGMPCEWELMLDLTFVRDAFAGSSGRELFLPRVMNMLDRFQGNFAITGMLGRVLGVVP